MTEAVQLIATGDVSEAIDWQKKPVVYAEGALGSGKTRLLLQRAEHLLKTQPSTSLLILAVNHSRQQRIIKTFYRQLDMPIGQLPVYTYLGYVRNTLFDWWPLVEKKILETMPETAVKLRPELSGLEDSELLLTLNLQEVKQDKPDIFSAFPGTDRVLVKQLVRRLRLRSENRLSRQQMMCRSQTMDELCWVDTSDMERRFDKASYALRTLDSNKQIDVFHRLLEDQKDPDCIRFQTHVRQQVRHLLMDDLDESIPAAQAFAKFLAQSADSMYLAADPNGGTRRGYLNAYPYSWEEIKQWRDGEILTLTRPDVDNKNGISVSAETLLSNWNVTDSVFAPLSVDSVVRYDDFNTRVEMLDGVVEKITQALAEGSNPGDYCLLLPQADVIGLYHLQQQLQSRGVPIQLVSGTQRPSDNPLVRAFLCLLQLANRPRWWVPLSMWEMKTVLTQVLQLPVFSRDILDDLVRACVEHQADLSSGASLLPNLSELPMSFLPAYAERYQALWDWLELTQKQSFEDQLYSAFNTLIAPIASTETPLGDLKRVLDSYQRQREVYKGYLAQQIKAQKNTLTEQQLALFESDSTDSSFDRLWLLQAKSGVVADTPDTPSEPETDALIIGTPQSVLNMQIRRPVHIWLDIGSREWCRTDHAPLYHAWVHSPLCSDDEASVPQWLTDETTQRMLFEKAGHLTRTLMLLATKQVWLFGSQLDDEGRLQDGPLLERAFIQSDAQAMNSQSVPEIRLRDDQAPVLQYQGGTLAISAVPGAGKTFTNVALILHLIQKLDIPPDQILVLTYMESAAQTLQGRVKRQLEARGIRGKVPAISTIHSLAMRILTDNDHARRVGLMPQEFSILDEFRQDEILQKIQAQLQCKNYGRVIQSAKMLGITPEEVERFLQYKPQHARLLEFYPAYRLYMQTMQETGLLDFDDLILKAIYLLENYPDILEYYRQKYTIVIEDEAQDSSKTLQKLIQLIAGDSSNIIRTGDTNQSITTTFSSADPSVFRDFISDAKLTVEMKYSARCAPEVIALSNDWVRHCLEGQESLKKAFQWMEMRPVEGQNPSLLFPMYAKGFETSQDETLWLVESIARLKSNYPDETIAVLVRTNDQVNHICGQLQQAGIEAVSFNNQLTAHPVFNLVLCWLRLLACPFSLDQMDRTVTLNYQLKLYQAYIDAKLITHDEDKKEFLETQLLLFQVPGETVHPQYESIVDADLAQMYYDGLEFSTDVLRGRISQLIIKMVNRLFQSVEARSNGYLCALLAEQALNRVRELENLSPVEVVIQQFDQFQRTRGGKKGFGDLLQQDMAKVVQVMTLHKSKGQEFDIVLMPYMQQSAFRHEPNLVDFSDMDRVQQSLQEVLLFNENPKAAVNPQEMMKNYEWTLKQSVIEEENRLGYVGFTRAKRALILTAHSLNNVLGFGRRKAEKTQPALIFQWAYHWIQKEFAPKSEATVPAAGNVSEVTYGA